MTTIILSIKDQKYPHTHNVRARRAPRGQLVQKTEAQIQESGLGQMLPIWVLLRSSHVGAGTG